MKCRLKESSTLSVSISLLLQVVVMVLHAAQWESVPFSQTAYLGGEALFQAVGRAAEPFTYQWQHNGTDIPGARESVLILRDLKESQAGDYRAILKLDSGRTLASPSAALNLVRPPAPRWILQPDDAVRLQGEQEPVRLEGKAYSPVPINYQWMQAGRPVVGATNTSLSITVPPAPGMAGYRLAAGNAGLAINSRVARVVRAVANAATVIFANRWPGGPDAPVFSANGTTKVEGTNLVAQLYAGHESKDLVPVGTPRPFRTGAGAGYWKSNDPLLVLPEISAGDRAWGLVRVWDGRDGQTYEVASARGGATGNSERFLIDTGSVAVPGSLASPPQPLRGLRTFMLHGNASYFVPSPPELEVGRRFVTGRVGEQLLLEAVLLHPESSSINFQWRFNGTNLPGENNLLLKIPSARLEHSGRYDLVARNAGGETVSASILALIVQDPLPVLLIERQGGTSTPQWLLSVSDESPQFAPLFFQWFLNGSPVPGATNRSFLKVGALRDSGESWVVVSNMSGTVVNFLQRLELPPPASFLRIVSSGYSYPGSDFKLQVEHQQVLDISITGLPVYDWYRDGALVSTGRFQPSLEFVPFASQHLGDYRVVLSNALGSVTSANFSVRENPAPFLSFVNHPQSGTHMLSGQLMLYAEAAFGGRYDPTISYIWRKNMIPISTNRPGRFLKSNLMQEDVGEYDVIAFNAAGSATSRVAVISGVLPPAPGFFQHPIGAIQAAGSEYSMSILATALRDEKVELQWRLSGLPISGAMSSSLSLVLTSTNQSGDYDVVARTIGGSSTSRVARVTVLVPPHPKILEQPQGSSVARGIDYTFQISTFPSNVLQRYQWRFNGKDISGATNRILRLNPVEITHAGVYQVRVQNEGGEVESSEARLIVHEAVPPKILFQPKPVRIQAGQPFSMGVSVLGSQPFAFQWRHNGRDIPGATNQSFGRDYAIGPDAGSYSVVFSNSGGQVESQAAAVEIQGMITNNLAVDFNSDGYNDLVFQHSDGSIGVWYMHSEILVGAGLISHRPDNSNGKWRVVGAASFKQDGHPDLLLEFSFAPTAVVWHLNGTNLIGGQYINSTFRYSGPSRRIVSGIDYNRDGNPDLLWETSFRYPDGLDGKFMNAEFLNRLSHQDDAPLEFSSSPQAGFRLLGSGDLNGDGYPDLIWQKADGVIAVWFQRETNYVSAGVIGVADPGWRLGAVVDLDGDGKSDLVFQHEDGLLAVWFVDGDRLKRTAFLEPRYAGEGWSLVAPR